MEITRIEEELIKINEEMKERLEKNKEAIGEGVETVEGIIKLSEEGLYYRDARTQEIDNKIQEIRESLEEVKEEIERAKEKGIDKIRVGSLKVAREEVERVYRYNQKELLKEVEERRKELWLKFDKDILDVIEKENKGIFKSRKALEDMVSIMRYEYFDYESLENQYIEVSGVIKLIKRAIK